MGFILGIPSPRDFCIQWYRLLGMRKMMPLLMLCTSAWLMTWGTYFIMECLSRFNGWKRVFFTAKQIHIYFYIINIISIFDLSPISIYQIYRLILPNPDPESTNVLLRWMAWRSPSMLQLLDAKGIGLGSARVFTYQVVSGQSVSVTFVLDKFPSCFYHHFLGYVLFRFGVHNRNHKKKQCFLF